jgi:hypothetical protein
LLTPPGADTSEGNGTDTEFFDDVQLQSDRDGEVEGGRNYADDFGTSW